MSFPRYEKYKDSGIEWLGEVPEHWGLPKLKHFTNFSGGGTPSRDNPKYWNGDIPWVSPKDMKAERIDGAEERITQAGLENSSSLLVPGGHVLVVVRSGILKHTIPVAINQVPVALNQDMKSLDFARDRCLSEFFLRGVQGLNNLLLLVWAKQGATVESIEHTYLAETVIPLPPIAEQQAITTFLDRETAKIDALIAEQQRLIELLKEKRQAVISHAVTKGLPIPSPHGGGVGGEGVPMKDSGIEWLDEVPAYWDVCAVRRILKRIEQGWSPECINRPADSDEWGILKSGCVNRGIFIESENKALPENLEPLPEYEVKEADILMSRASGSPELIGSVAFVAQTRPRLMLSDKIFRFRLSERIQPRFFVALFSARYLRAQIEQSISGAQGLANNLPQSSLKTFNITLPPIGEQSAIVAFLDRETAKLDTLTAEAQRAIELLKERRTALISAAVTGKIDVRDYQTFQD